MRAGFDSKTAGRLANKMEGTKKGLGMKWLASWLAIVAVVMRAASGSDIQSLPDGTLLGLENANSVVERVTRGEIGHVAMVFREGSTTWVYEATPAKVRRVSGEAYLQELGRLNGAQRETERMRVWALTPKAAYSAEEIAKMRSYLDAQVGRRYSVKNYVRQQPSDGIHCAELAASTLNQSERYAFADCCKLHPQAIYAALLSEHSPPQEIGIPAFEAKEAWCARAQRSWAGWYLWCRWSMREAWLWCW